MLSVALLDWHGLIITVVVVIVVDVDVVLTFGGREVVGADVLTGAVVVDDAPCFPSTPERNSAATTMSTSTAK